IGLFVLNNVIRNIYKYPVSPVVKLPTSQPNILPLLPDLHPSPVTPLKVPLLKGRLRSNQPVPNAPGSFNSTFALGEPPVISASVIPLIVNVPFDRGLPEENIAL